MLYKEVTFIHYRLRPLGRSRSERVGSGHGREALEMVNSSPPDKLV